MGEIVLTFVDGEARRAVAEATGREPGLAVVDVASRESVRASSSTSSDSRPSGSFGTLGC
jgi:hypothetical protein